MLVIVYLLQFSCPWTSYLWTSRFSYLGLFRIFPVLWCVFSYKTFSRYCTL